MNLTIVSPRPRGGAYRSGNTAGRRGAPLIDWQLPLHPRALVRVRRNLQGAEGGHQPADNANLRHKSDDKPSLLLCECTHLTEFAVLMHGTSSSDVNNTTHSSSVELDDDISPPLLQLHLYACLVLMLFAFANSIYSSIVISTSSKAAIRRSNAQAMLNITIFNTLLMSVICVHILHILGQILFGYEHIALISRQWPVLWGFMKLFCHEENQLLANLEVTQLHQHHHMLFFTHLLHPCKLREIVERIRFNGGNLVLLQISTET